MSDDIKTEVPTIKAKALNQNRTTQTRNFELRDSDIRDKLRMSHSDALHIAKEKIPEGMVYHWGRDSVRDQPDPSRIPELQQRFWTLVPADRHPEMVTHRLDDRTRHLDGFIQIKGLVLMERPERVSIIEREMEEEASYKSMVNLPVNEVLESGETRRLGIHPRTYANQTAIQTMKSFKE